MKMCLPNRTMYLMHMNNNMKKMMNLSIIPLILILMIFTINVNSSILFRKIPNPTYQTPEGYSLELSCFTEQSNVNCFWLKNNTIVINSANKYRYLQQSNQGDCSLSITNLEYPKDDAIWVCQAFVNGEESSDLVIPWPKTKVTVLVKPTEPLIRYEGISESPTADQPSIISCHSTNGNPLPRIDWFLNDSNNITEFANITVDKRTIVSTLNYTFKKFDNGSILSCVVVHPTGNQTKKQILNVQYKPQVSVKQKLFTITKGNDLDIECHVDANPEANVFWKPAAKIDDRNYRIDKNKLLLRNISEKLDGNEFQCSAQNNIGSSETESVKLNVLYPPKLIEIHYPKKAINLGEDIRLECLFIGNPKPLIRWSFTDFIRNHQYFLEPESGNSGVLIIKNATYLNEGNYYCDGINYNSILNKENIFHSTKFPLDVKGKPLFIKERQTVIGYRGLDTKIEQQFCSDPKPDKVFWFYGANHIEVDTNIDSSNSLKDQTMDQILVENYNPKPGRLIKIDTLSPNPNCYRVALIITNTDTQDIRDYTLFVQNQKGKAEGIVTLTVNSPLSIAAVIAFALIILVIVLAITIGIILLRRRPPTMNDDKQLDPEIVDDDVKNEGQVPNQDSYENNCQNISKTKNGH